MGVTTHDLPILASARLSLVGVDDEISRPGVILPSRLVHEAPLEAGWESCATPSPHSGSLHLRDDPLVSLQDDLLCPVPVTPRLGSLEQVVVAHVRVREDAVLVLQSAMSPLGRILHSGKTADATCASYSRSGSSNAGTCSDRAACAQRRLCEDGCSRRKEPRQVSDHSANRAQRQACEDTHVYAALSMFLCVRGRSLQIVLE